MRAGYQQAAEMLYISNIRTQEGNKVHVDKLFQNMAGWHSRASQTGDAIYYEPRVAVVLKHCQGCMRVHVCVGFVKGRL